MLRSVCFFLENAKRHFILDFRSNVSWIWAIHLVTGKSLPHPDIKGTSFLRIQELWQRLEQITDQMSSVMTSIFLKKIPKRGFFEYPLNF